MSKNLDPNILPEKQHTNAIKCNTEKPCIGQGRAGMRRRRPSPINQTIIQPSDLSQKIPGAAEIETRITNHANSTAPAHSINNANERITQRRPLPTDVHFYPGPTYRPLPKPISSFTPESHEGLQSLDSSEITNIIAGINLDFEENSPFQEGVISDAYQRSDKFFFQEPHELHSLVNTGNLAQKFLSKQADIDKILKMIQRKVLKGMHLPVEIKEIQAGYLSHPYFKDIYLYLAQNKLPSSRQQLER